MVVSFVFAVKSVVEISKESPAAVPYFQPETEESLLAPAAASQALHLSDVKCEVDGKMEDRVGAGLPDLLDTCLDFPECTIE
jgi:hypothetical protein